MSTFLLINIKSLVIELLIITAIISAILVIISKNPVVSVIYLISLILNAALFLIVKGMPFIGISYILIYLGAIIVLFLFVIMMININLTDILETGFNYTKNIPLALVVSGLFIYEFINILPSYLNNSVLSLNNSLLYSIYIDSVLFINNLVLALSSAYDIGSEGFSFTSIGGGNQINLFFNELNEHYYPLMASNN
jgi:NADH-ubiquinone oxidoreductase chain 6